MPRSKDNQLRTRLVGAIIVVLLAGSAVSHAQQASEESRTRAAILAAAKHVTGEDRTPPSEKRYTAEGCKPDEIPEAMWAGFLAPYRGLPVKDCTVKGLGTTGRALLLLPTAAQIADWVVFACLSSSQTSTKLEACGTKLIARINKDNGWQFIVSGLIREPIEEGYGDEELVDKRCMAVAARLAKNDQQVLFSFRHGVTVTLKDRFRTSWRKPIEDGCEPLLQPSDTELETFLTAPVNAEPRSVKSYGRVSGLHRKLYAPCRNAFGSVRVAPPSDDQWLTIVRNNTLAAWHSEADGLLILLARALFNPSGSCKA